MGKPAVRRSAVPVLYTGHNVDHIAGVQFLRLFALFLIVTAPGHADKDLSAAFVRLVDVPVVTAVNWTPYSQSLVVTGFNGIHVCALCKPFVTSSFCQVTLSRPRSKPLLQD